MNDTLDSASHAPRLSKTAFGAVLPIAALAAIVAYTRTGIDLLALALVVLFVVAVERTVGDWFAELMGPALSSVVLAGAAGFCVWQLLAGGGRENTYGFFMALEDRGYKTLYLKDAMNFGARHASGLRGTSGTGHSSIELRRGSDAGQSAARQSDLPRPTSSVARSRIAMEAPPRGERDRLGSGANALGRGLSHILTLSVPSEAQAGEAVTVSAKINSGAAPLGSGRVEFLLDGRVVGTADIRRDGTAVAQLIAPRSGTHTLRARVAGAKGVRGAVTDTTLVVRP